MWKREGWFDGDGDDGESEGEGDLVGSAEGNVIIIIVLLRVVVRADFVRPHRDLLTPLVLMCLG